MTRPQRDPSSLEHLPPPLEVFEERKQCPLTSQQKAFPRAKQTVAPQMCSKVKMLQRRVWGKIGGFLFRC